MIEVVLPQGATPILRFGRRLLNWWFRELAEILSFTRFGRPKGEDITCSLQIDQNGSAVIRQLTDGSSAVVALVATDDGYTAPAEASVFAGQNAQILLSESLCFKPCIELPLAAESSIRSILQNQLERLVPLDPATLCFRWIIKERVPDRNVLRVQLYIVKEATIGKALTLAKELSLRTRVVVAAPQGVSPLTFWVARSDGATRKERWGRRGLEATALLCLAASYMVFVWHLEQTRDVLRREVSELRVRSQSIALVSDRAIAAEKMLKEVNQKLKGPTALAIIDGLAKNIPSDGYLSQIHLAGDRVEIVGNAPNAANILAAVERCDLFQSPSFLAPVTADSAGSTERYQIGFQLKAR